MPPPTTNADRKAAAPRAAHPKARPSCAKAALSPSPMPAPDAIPALPAPAAPGGVFSEAVFGARLARALDALLAMQRARDPSAAQIARGPRSPLAALFTTQTGGPSLFEADSLTLHFLCGGVSLAALVAHHRCALPHVAEALDSLEIVDVRALLWERAAAAAAAAP